MAYAQNGYSNQGYNGNQPRNFYNTNCDFINVNGPQQVREYIVNPGQKVYFMDNNNPLMYVKQADNFGVTKTTACKLTEVDFDSLLAPPPSPAQIGVSKEDFNKLFDALSNLSARVDAMENSKPVNNQNGSKKNGNFRRDKNE